MSRVVRTHLEISKHFVQGSRRGCCGTLEHMADPDPDPGLAQEAGCTHNREPRLPAELTTPPSQNQVRVRRYRAAAKAELTDVSGDDGDIGWGDRPGEDSERDDWYRSERPPHHGG
jgi:hypothetical protein